MRFIYAAILLLFPILSLARFEIATTHFYNSYSDGNTKNSFTNMTNGIFIGASLDSKQKLLIGQHVQMGSVSLKSSTTDTLDYTEIGPRVTYYFSDDYNFFTSLSWCPYLSGTRKAAGSASEDIKGWSYSVLIGGSFKINRNFALGTGIIYHAINLSESTVGSTSTDISHSYSGISPVFNFILRFR
jgi:hypothetical protein